MRKRILWFMAGVAMACSGGEDDFVSSESGREMPLLKPEIEAMDGVLPASFAAGDLFGIYVACGDAGSEPVLQASGNYRDNAPVVYNEGSLSWDEEIYFPLNGGDMAVYAYAPYIAAVENSLEVPFAVEVDQYPEGAYEASDFLWAKEIVPQDGTGETALRFSHRMSRVVLVLTPGEGVDLSGGMDVRLSGIRRECRINLQTGSVHVPAEAPETEIFPRSEDGMTYEVVLPPQYVPAAVRFVKLTTATKSWSWVTPSGGCTLRAGETLTFNLTLTDD